LNIVIIIDTKLLALGNVYEINETNGKKTATK